MSLSFDRVAEEYDATRGGEERGANIARAMAPLLRGPGRVLEVGVGTGVVALALRRAGRSVVGVDIAAGMLRRARERLGGVVARADGAALPFGDGEFAAAYAVWVMHAVGDPGAVLHEVARTLRPGGVLAICHNRMAEPDAITEVVVPLLAALGRPYDEEAQLSRLAALGEASGLVSRGASLGPPTRFRETPAEIADAMDRRSLSGLWNVGDEQWRNVVAPAIGRIRALGEAPMTRTKRERFLLLERPAPV
jgi:SAM-dependent methyltransferase